MLQRVPEIIDCTIKMWRGEYEMVEFHTPSTYSDPAICDLLLPAVSDVVGAENVSEVACSAGTEDFGYFTERHRECWCMWEPEGRALNLPQPLTLP